MDTNFLDNLARMESHDLQVSQQSFLIDRQIQSFQLLKEL